MEPTVDAREHGGEGSSRRLAERYGREPAGRSRRRLWAVAGVLGAAFLAWVVWAGLGLAGQQGVTEHTVGFTDVTDSSVVLTFEVTKDPDATVTCEVRALSPDFATIGYDTVEIGRTDAPVVRTQVTIATQQRAVSAEVYGCEEA